MPKTRKKYWGGFFPEYELRRRETGFNCKLGWEESVKHTLYSSLHPCNSWDPIFSCSNSGLNARLNGAYHGGIFNLEFSPDGKQLVAACEKKAIMIFDPLSRKQIFDVPHAHLSCVNGIKFLDNRVFATCSDDKTVALWDVRNLRRKILRLQGHNNWVKNIEYASNEGLLVTSGFDGRILGWNINRYTSEENGQCSELFSMQGLMRIRLSPDFSKLIICTTEGYVIVIHDLSLKNLSSDLQDFKPNIYRLMQISNTPLPQTANFTSLFYRKRNRVEFISDFPPGNDAEVIHSLQVHPQGWCILSRNTSTGDSSEWTCVHDIQNLDLKKEELEDLESKESEESDSSGDLKTSLSRESFPASENGEGSQDLLAVTINPRLEVMLRNQSMMETRSEGNQNDDGTANEDADEDDTVDTRPSNSEGPSSFHVQPRFMSASVLDALEHVEQRRAWTPYVESYSLSGPVTHSPDRVEALSGGSQETPSSSRADFRLRQRRRGDWGGSEVTRGNYRNAFFIRRGANTNHSILLLHLLNCYPQATLEGGEKSHHRIVRNAPRLTNYIEEPNKGKGFIKELCFSTDGRLICSPFDCGVRLLMFNERCSELSHCVQKTPQQLFAVSNNVCHTNCVVSTKFSPVDFLLVSGCLNGKIVWHQPLI